jgi:hypothetical protein
MNEEFAILLFFFGISVTANVGFLIGAFRSARRLRRFENRLLTPTTADDVRVERLEQAMETMDARLDQLVRGQEFLSKLVSERRHVIAKRERDVTPV